MVAWRISGRLIARDDLTNPIPPPPPVIAGAPASSHFAAVRPKPLIGITVLLCNGDNVLASSHADEQGNFLIEKDMSDRARRLSVEIAFVSDDLSITAHKKDSDVVRFSVYEDEERSAETTRSLGDLYFHPDSAHEALADRRNNSRALLWYAAMTLIRRLRRTDPWLAFGGRIRIQWPAPTAFNASYATHIVNRRVGLDNDLTNTDPQLMITLLHEMMHIWNYDHNKGVTAWHKGICSRRFGFEGTAGRQEWPNIAFHEAFSEFAAEELLHELFGRERPLPFRRAFITQSVSPPLTSLADSERSQNGVRSALRCLVTPNLERYQFGAASDGVSPSEITERDFLRPDIVCPKWPAFTIWEILKLFRGRPGSDFPTDWEVGDKNYGIRRFLRRAAVLAPTRVSDEIRQMIVDLIDPTNINEPTTLCSRRPSVERIEPTTPDRPDDLKPPPR